MAGRPTVRISKDDRWSAVWSGGRQVGSANFHEAWDGRVDPLRGWIIATFSTSLITQVVATSLISWRIVSTFRWKTNVARKEQLSIVWMIVESGAILTATSVTVLTLFVLNINAGTLITSVISQLSVRTI